jgi:thiamine kinase-like enzyme
MKIGVMKMNRMEKMLKKGKIEKLVPINGGGLTGEVHLLEYKSKKYILRRCRDAEAVREYISIVEKYKKYGFFPKLLGKHNTDLLFEFIDGREVRREREFLKTFEQIGKIAAQINKVKYKGETSEKFVRRVNALVTGNYKGYEKKRSKKPKIFTKKEGEKIIKTYKYLVNVCKPKIVFDINDVTHSNFIVTKKGKVFLVDIGAVRPLTKGYGVAKCFLQVSKKESQQKAFLKGYSSISSIKFLTQEYYDLIYLSFFVLKAIRKVAYFESEVAPYILNKINKIVKRYKNE